MCSGVKFFFNPSRLWILNPLEPEWQTESAHLLLCMCPVCFGLVGIVSQSTDRNLWARTPRVHTSFTSRFLSSLRTRPRCDTSVDFCSTWLSQNCVITLAYSEKTKQNRTRHRSPFICPRKGPDIEDNVNGFTTSSFTDCITWINAELERSIQAEHEPI